MKTNTVCVFCVMTSHSLVVGYQCSVGIQSLEGKFTKNWRPLIRMQCDKISKGITHIIQKCNIPSPFCQRNRSNLGMYKNLILMDPCIVV